MTIKELIPGEIYTYQWPQGRVIVLHEHSPYRHFVNAINNYEYGECCDKDDYYREANEEEKEFLIHKMKSAGVFYDIKQETYEIY